MIGVTVKLVLVGVKEYGRCHCIHNSVRFYYGEIRSGARGPRSEVGVNTGRVVFSL